MAKQISVKKSAASRAAMRAKARAEERLTDKLTAARVRFALKQGGFAGLLELIAKTGLSTPTCARAYVRRHFTTLQKLGLTRSGSGVCTRYSVKA